MKNLLSGLLILVFFVSGCGMHPVYVDELDVRHPELMVAQKVQTPLFIVLDPSEVPESAKVDHTQLKPIDVHNIHAFVELHLAEAMKNYFETVEIVGPDHAFDSSPHIVGRVQLSEIDVLYDSVTSGGYSAGRIYGQISWSFGLLPLDSEDFIFSYAGSSRGEYPLTHVSETSDMYASTFAVAIMDMLRSYTDKEIQKALREVEQAPAVETATEESADDSL